MSIVTGIFDQLFRRKKDVTSKDLKIALLGLKRDRKRKHLEMKKLTTRRADMVERIKRGRKDGNSLEVDVMWEEIKQLRVDMAYCGREAKVLTLESIGVTRYLKGLERLERQKDEKRIEKLIDRIRTSGLDEKLRGSEIDEMAYRDALNATLEEVGLEIEDIEGADDEDPEKAKFLEEIDAINMAEAAGDVDVAVAKQEKLHQKLDTEKPKEKEEDL